MLNNGKKVATTKLEGLFALHKPISQVCILGDDRSYVTALLVPNFDFFSLTTLRPGDLASMNTLYSIRMKGG